MDDVCNRTRLFVKTFDSYYYNCFTFQPQMILKSRATRLSGVEYGLSLLLFLGQYTPNILPALCMALTFILSQYKKHSKNVGPIRHCEPPHAHSPGVATVARTAMAP